MSTPSRLPLEAIEKASIDELRSLQLKRLKATLQHAYDNSPVYKLKFDKAGVQRMPSTDAMNAPTCTGSRRSKRWPRSSLQKKQKTRVCPYHISVRLWDFVVK